MMKKTYPKSNVKTRSGAATVEFALVVPIFFMVLFGIVEVSWALCSTNVATNIARETAHLAIMVGETETEILNHGKTLGASLLSVDQSKITLNLTVTDSNGASVTYANAARGDLVSVEVTVPFSDLSLLSGSYMANSSIRGTSSMMKL